MLLVCLPEPLITNETQQEKVYSLLRSAHLRLVRCGDIEENPGMAMFEWLSVCASLLPDGATNILFLLVAASIRLLECGDVEENPGMAANLRRHRGQTCQAAGCNVAVNRGHQLCRVCYRLPGNGGPNNNNRGGHPGRGNGGVDGGPGGGGAGGGGPAADGGGAHVPAPPDHPKHFQELLFMITVQAASCMYAGAPSVYLKAEQTGVASLMRRVSGDALDACVALGHIADASQLCSFVAARYFASCEDVRRDRDVRAAIIQTAANEATNQARMRITEDLFSTRTRQYLRHRILQATAWFLVLAIFFVDVCFAACLIENSGFWGYVFVALCINLDLVYIVYSYDFYEVTGPKVSIEIERRFGVDLPWRARAGCDSASAFP